MRPQKVPSTDRTVTQGLHNCAAERLVPQGRLACVKGQNILFSPTQGAMFSLNETAADIWRLLEEGAAVEAIHHEMAKRGVERHVVQRYLEAILTDWERLGLVRPDPPLPSSRQECLQQIVTVAGLRIQIRYPTPHGFPAMTAFRHLEASCKATDILLDLVAHRRRIHLYRGRSWIGSCTPEELPVAVKGQLLAEVLERSAYALALHAASLISNGHAALLCGGPGSGKTTLALALLRAGFGYAADDVTLLAPDGRSLGLAFAATVKAGSWPVLAGYFPELGKAPTYRRPDRKRVRYLVPEQFVPPAPRPVRWVILLHRTRHAAPHLEPIDPLGTLRVLLDGAYAPGGELTDAAFDALSEVVGSAQAFCLTYWDLKDAAETIDRACR